MSTKKREHVTDITFLLWAHIANGSSLRTDCSHQVLKNAVSLGDTGSPQTPGFKQCSPLCCRLARITDAILANGLPFHTPLSELRPMKFMFAARVYFS